MIDLDELKKRTTRHSVLGGHGLDVVNMHGSDFDALIAELRTLRARVAELEEENEQLRWARRASCVRTPTPGCDCPGCETARERSAQADLVASYEAELEEDRQAERDRILGARIREIARQHDPRLYTYGFVREVMRAMEEEIDKEAAR